MHPDTDPDLDQAQAERELVAQCRGLAARGLVLAAAGNASVSVGEHLLLTATGAVFAELERDDLVLVDRGGRVLSGARPPTSELALHLAAHALPGTRAVVHTHGRHAVALSTVADVVPALHYYALDLGGPVPVAPYRTYGTQELADVTTQVLAGRTAVVMAHHGSTTVGSTLASAAARADLLEWLCEVALLAQAAGRPAQLSDEQLAQVREQTAQRAAAR
jgi:L-fuculose-phosphate aldolase